MRAIACSLALLSGLALVVGRPSARELSEAPDPDAAHSGPTETYTTFESIEYNVEKAVHTGPDAGEVTVTLYHKYPSSLHNVRLHGASDVLDVKVAPALAEEFKPTDFLSFIVHASLSRPIEADRVSLPLAIHADEFTAEPTIEVTVPLTAAAEREVNESLTLPVGAVEVRVTPYGNLAYYGCIVGTLGIIGWLIVRRRRAA